MTKMKKICCNNCSTITLMSTCAFIYLHEKLGGKGDIVSAAEHDVIYLNFDNIEELTDEDVLYLTRCGVLYNTDCLSMFV